MSHYILPPQYNVLLLSVGTPENFYFLGEFRNEASLSDRSSMDFLGAEKRLGVMKPTLREAKAFLAIEWPLLSHGRKVPLVEKGRRMTAARREELKAMNHASQGI